MPADQRWAESALLTEGDLGRGWRSIPMINNVEQPDPFGPGPDADAVRAARAARVLTALDEGEAWRRRNDRILAVARVEVYGSADDREHRAAWRAHGPACLDATWRQRWRDREVEPGWVEARWQPDDDRPRDDLGPSADEAVDWLVVEDHTGTDVAVYEHVTIWCGRLQFTLTVRHLLGVDLGDAIAFGAAAVVRRATATDPASAVDPG